MTIVNKNVFLISKKIVIKIINEKPIISLLNQLMLDKLA